MLEAPSPYADFEIFYKYISEFQEIVPSIIRKYFSQYRYGFSSEILLIKNLPFVSQEVLTPQSCSNIPIKQDYTTEAVLTLFADQIGYVFGYEQERNGQIIQNVVPERKRQYINSSEGSAVPLELHIDNGYLDCPPDFVCLLCVRNNSEKIPETRVIHALEIIDSLEKEDLRNLMSPEFSIRFSHSFVRTENDILWSEKRPIIVGPLENPEIRLKLGMTRAMTSRATRSLEKLKVICENRDIGHSIALLPGDLLILPNRRLLHGRSKFSSTFDGYDRWLHRAYTLNDPWRWRQYFKVNRRIMSLR